MNFIAFQPINEYSRKLVQSRWEYTKDFEAAMKKIQAENHAIIGAETVMYNYLSKNDPCSMTKMGPTIFQGPIVLPWKKNFPYAHIFTYQQEIIMNILFNHYFFQH